MSPNIWFYRAFSLLFISGVLHLAIDVLIPLFRSASLSIDEHTTFIGMHSFYAIFIIGIGLSNVYLLKAFPAIFNDNFIIGLHAGIGALLLIGVVLFLGAKPPIVTMVLFLGFLIVGFLNVNLT